MGGGVFIKKIYLKPITENEIEQPAIEILQLFEWGNEKEAGHVLPLRDIGKRNYETYH